jgi:hypothetical protein
MSAPAKGTIASRDSQKLSKAIGDQLHLLRVRHDYFVAHVNSRLTHGECVPVSRVMRPCGIFENVCFIASGVIATFCSRMIFPIQNAAARPAIAEVQTNRELVSFANHVSFCTTCSICGFKHGDESTPTAT